jgi:hypothetical protein
MKIGLISFHSFYHPGGVKRHILGLHKEFQKRGIPSKIIAPRRTLKEDYGKEIILLGTSFPFPFSGGISDLAINFNPRAIEKVLKRENLIFYIFIILVFLQLFKSSSVLFVPKL